MKSEGGCWMPIIAAWIMLKLPQLRAILIDNAVAAAVISLNQKGELHAVVKFTGTRIGNILQ
jgi:hypothetical protein